MPRLIADVVAAGAVSSVIQPTLTVDEELRLRPFDERDVDAVIAAFETPDIQYFHFRHLDGGEALEWIEAASAAWSAERSATWAVVDRADVVVGRVTMYLWLGEGRGEVSYWVLPDARRRQVATRACRASTAWAHGIGIHRVELQHSTKNEASRRVAEDAGFVREGIKRAAIRLADGWHDMVLHSHLPSDDAGPSAHHT